MPEATAAAELVAAREAVGAVIPPLCDSKARDAIVVRCCFGGDPFSAARMTGFGARFLMPAMYTRIARAVSHGSSTSRPAQMRFLGFRLGSSRDALIT